MGEKVIETEGSEINKKNLAVMGEEEDVSRQENGLTVDLQEQDKKKKKKKEKKKEKKGSVDGGDKSVEGEQERPEKLNQGEKGQEGNEDLVTDVEMCLEKESDKDEENIKKKRKKRSEDVSDDSEGKAVTDEDKDGEKQKKKKKKKKKKKNLKSTDLSDGLEVEAEANEESGKSKKKKKTNNESVSDGVGDEAKTSEKVEKSKKKKLKSKDVPGGVEVEAEAAKEIGKSKKEKKTDDVSISDGVGDKGEDVEKSKKKKEKKRKRGDISSVGEEDKDKDDNCGKKKNNDKKAGKGKKIAENPTAKRSTKRVSFADDLEVPYKEARPQKYGEVWEGMVQGKRYTPEEDEMLRDAVSKYIEEHNLGENGIDMILNCRAHKEIKYCWKEIAEALPQRPLESVYYRGHMLYERADTSEWTAEEKEYVKEFYKKHGADWKTLASELNKHRHHVKEAWRRNRLENVNHGRWSQKEYQSLFDLVNKDLSMRALEERKSKHGMIRDNISWEAISDTMTTRHTANCCVKWYNQLTSPLVAQGLWSDTDDYRLVNALLELDAPNIDEVEWDSLLEHRDGEIALKRWKQMVKHIGDYLKLSFSQQVEVLGQRYSPEFIPAREEFDSQPFVDC